MLQKIGRISRLTASEVLLFCRDRLVPMIVESDRSDEPLTPVNFSCPLLIFATSTRTLCFFWGGTPTRLLHWNQAELGQFTIGMGSFFGVTFSPCCKWVLVECEGRGLAEGGERLGRGGNLSGENGSCGERRAWLHWDSAPEGAACSAQSEPHRAEKKVLLSASNDPLDNHTGTKRLYLTLIANPGPPISELHDSPALPCHLPAQRREPSLNGIYNHPSSVSTLIVILRLELCIKHLARLKWRPWLQCLLWALMTFPSEPQRRGDCLSR